MRNIPVTNPYPCAKVLRLTEKVLPLYNSKMEHIDTVKVSMHNKKVMAHLPYIPHKNIKCGGNIKSFEGDIIDEFIITYLHYENEV